MATGRRWVESEDNLADPDSHHRLPTHDPLLGAAATGLVDIAVTHGDDGAIAQQHVRSIPLDVQVDVAPAVAAAKGRAMGLAGRAMGLAGDAALSTVAVAGNAPIVGEKSLAATDPAAGGGGKGPGNRKPKPAPRVQNLDGVRGLGILLVMAYHLRLGVPNAWVAIGEKATIVPLVLTLILVDIGCLPPARPTLPTLSPLLSSDSLFAGRWLSPPRTHPRTHPCTA